MCPTFERHERELHLDLSDFEIIPETKNNKMYPYPRIDHLKAVKKYHRPAAGNEAPLPEDVRTTTALKKTMEYLLDEILVNRQEALIEKYHFIRDRTRSIRQDFTVQSLKDDNFVELNEQIARFHILAGHLLCEYPKDTFDPFQNTEQLRKVLTSLDEIYSDLHKNALHQIVDTKKALVNEAEFCAYYLLTHLQDRNTLTKVNSFSPQIINSSNVQFALHCYSAYFENNYTAFFALCSQANIFEFCLLAEHFYQVRSNALAAIEKSFNPNAPVPVEYFLKTFMFEDSEECLEFFAHQQIQCNNNLLMLRHKMEVKQKSFLKRRIGKKFLTSLPSTENLKSFICGEQVQSKDFIPNVVAEMTASLFKNVITEHLNVKTCEFSISLELFSQFFHNFFENEVRGNLLSYSQKILSQFHEIQVHQSMSTSLEIFNIIFGQFLFQLVAEEVDAIWKQRLFPLLLATRRIIRHFRMKQSSYKRIFDYIREKIREFEECGIEFYSFLTKVDFETGKSNEKRDRLEANNSRTEQNGVMKEANTLHYVVLFFDDLDVYNEKIDTFTFLQPIIVWICVDSFVVPPSVTFVIDFYSIVSWSDVLERLFFDVQRLSKRTETVDRQQMLFLYFQSLVFSRWNSFSEAKCNNPSLVGKCKLQDIRTCLQSLFSNLNLQTVFSDALDSYRTCCMYHLSESVVELLKTTLARLPVDTVRMTGEELENYKLLLHSNLNDFLPNILRFIYFSCSQCQSNKLDIVFDKLLHELSDETEQTKQLDNLLSDIKA